MSPLAAQVDDQTVWSVARAENGARAFVAGADGTRLAIVCERSWVLNQLRLTGYRGERLSREDGAPANARILVEAADGGLTAFEAEFVYGASDDAWTAPIAPRGSIGPALARGEAVYVTVGNWEIAAFTLAGSSAAYNALLNACIQ